MPEYKTSKANIYYELHGSGPVILMVAGMSSDSKSWQFILDRMAKHYRMIIFDNRGCGRTETDGSTFDLKDLARDAFGLLDFLEYERVHVLGHSMGGMIAQEMTLMHPERIDKLILASTSPKMSQKAKEILDDLYDKWQNNYDMADWFRIMFQWLFTREALENKQFMDAAIIFALAYPYPQTLEGFKGQVDAVSRFDAIDRIHEIKQPCLIMSGEEDILIPTKESETLLKVSGNATMCYIEKAAHSIHAEQPHAFADAVHDFLAYSKVDG
jgi:pimeloyl-ACP methyl ester carboxylesterase